MSDVLCNILLNITYLKYLFFKVIFKLNSKPLFTVHTFLFSVLCFDVKNSCFKFVQAHYELHHVYENVKKKLVISVRSRIRYTRGEIMLLSKTSQKYVSGLNANTRSILHSYHRINPLPFVQLSSFTQKRVRNLLGTNELNIHL